jgi:PLP dependent protein
LLAVSKTFSADAVLALHAHGQLAFGENYVQEGVQKILDCRQALAQKPAASVAIEWHMIGPIQSNKTREVALHFDWVQSVDRLKIAQRLNDQRQAAGLAVLQVCVQVNVSGELSKSGCLPSEALALALAVSQMPSLRLRGLMAIPEPLNETSIAAGQQERLSLPDQMQLTKSLFDEIKTKVPHQEDFDTLSLGMSTDLELAVAAGSTMVRIGTALFGSRA